MYKKRKKNFIILIGSAIFLIASIVLIILEYLEEERFGMKERVAVLVGIFSAFTFVYGFLTENYKIGKIIKNIYKRIIDADPHESPVLPGTQQWEDNKQMLFDVIEQQCKNDIAEIKAKSPLIYTENLIEPRFIYYNSFEDFYNRENGLDQPRIKSAMVRLVYTGWPGNGKTYNILRQTEEEINRVKKYLAQNKNKTGLKYYKIPVYFSLRSWENETTLKEWLQKQLYTHFGEWLSENNINSLVDHSDFFPFLDGLDEINNKEDRLRCFHAIMEYGHGNSIMFGCRTLELRSLFEENKPEHINFLGVVELEMLDEEQIKNTIRKLKKNQKQIIDFLDQKPELYKFIDTPLILILFLSVFDKLSPSDKNRIYGMTSDEFKIYMWEHYDHSIFNSKKDIIEENKWTDKSVRTYIVELAKNINSNGFFLVEQMQPSWLGDKNGRKLLYYITSRLISCIILSIAIGFFIASPFDFVGNAAFSSLFIGLFSFAINPKTNIFYTSWKPVFMFTLLLVLLTGLYQGFAVPRRIEDLAINFSKTESYAGILLGLFMGIIFGFRKGKQNAFIDIQPIDDADEKFSFNVKRALKIGFFGGIIIGLSLAFSAVFIQLVFYDSSFYKWLGENVDKYIPFVRFSKGNMNLQRSFQVSIFGFIMGFIIGFLLFALLGGKDRVKLNLALKKDIDFRNRFKFNINYGIRKSLYSSLYYGLIVTFVTTLVYGVLIYQLTGHWESFKRGAYMGVGSGIIAFLWFGGFEVIHHWTLRLFLNLYGIIPRRYSQWIKVAQDLAFITRSGVSLQFYHNNLKDYFIGLKDKNEKDKILNLQKKKTLYAIIGTIILIGAGIIVTPFLNRYKLKKYWQHPNELAIKIDSTQLQKIGDNIYNNYFLMKKNGELNVEIYGKVKLGTFTGYVNATGTEIGLMGIEIGDSYDVEKPYRHGAILYRIRNSERSWEPLILDTTLRDKTFYRCFPVKMYDTLELMINDLEYQNNMGHYHVELKLLDTCAKPKK